jgi:hypothetical protein
VNLPHIADSLKDDNPMTEGSIQEDIQEVSALVKALTGKSATAQRRLDQQHRVVGELLRRDCALARKASYFKVIPVLHPALNWGSDRSGS